MRERYLLPEQVTEWFRKAQHEDQQSEINNDKQFAVKWSVSRL
jgi:hypothetical protein